MKMCEYGDHEITDNNGYVVYTDIKNGVPEDTITCNHCYAVHLLKHYPESTIVRLGVMVDLRHYNISQQEIDSILPTA